jgi:hypothetical protein
MLVCGLESPALALDPYDGLAWGKVSPVIQALPSLAPGQVSITTFRQFFRHGPSPGFADLVKACGRPAEEWNSELSSSRQVLPPHFTTYYAGDFLRYKLADGSRVYVWTGEDDGRVMRCDYITASGRVLPLYLRY